MANSYNAYTGDGSTQNFNITFGYLDRAHVTLVVAGVSVAFTWISDAQVQATVAPASGASVRVVRTTPATPIVDFVNGSTLVDDDLDNSTLQAIYIAQEAGDLAALSITRDTADDTWDGVSKRLKSLTDPVDAQDAATKAYVDAYAVATAAAQAAAVAAQAAAEAAQTSAETAETNAETAETNAETAETNAAASAAAAAASAASIVPGASVGLVLALGA